MTNALTNSAQPINARAGGDGTVRRLPEPVGNSGNAVTRVATTLA